LWARQRGSYRTLRLRRLKKTPGGKQEDLGRFAIVNGLTEDTQNKNKLSEYLKKQKYLIFFGELRVFS